MPELAPMLKGSSTRIPRTPLNSVLLLIATFELLPKRRTVPELVEPMLTLPVMEDMVVNARTILSGVPPTSSLLEIAMLDDGATTRMEEFVWPLNLLLTMVALQRPKLVWTALPEPGPGLLLFWIRLNCTNEGLMQVESNSMPEMLFWTMLLRIRWPPSVPEKPGLVQMPDRKHGSGKVEPWTVNPSSTTLSAMICTGPQGSSMIDSLAGANARVLASTPNCAPWRVRLFLLIWTCSRYRPGQTLIVSPGMAAATAALIVTKAGVRALQSVALASPSSSTTSVDAAPACPTVIIRP